MTNPSEERALAGLRQFDGHQPPPLEPEQHQQRAGHPGWQMFVSLILPGSAAMRRKPGLGFWLFVLGVVLPLGLGSLASVGKVRLMKLALNQYVLIGLVAIAVLFIVTRLIALIEVAGTYRANRVGSPLAVSLLALALISAPLAWAGLKVNQARTMVNAVFTGGSSEPVFANGEPDNAGGMRTILLIGVDAGPGRSGMRNDTMMLLTIHQESGRAGLISVQRDTKRLRPLAGSPLARAYPRGFREPANHLLTRVMLNEKLREGYTRDGLDPGALALAEALGNSLDIRIDDYAQIDMTGFIKAIDALGGVTITVEKSLHTPGPADDERQLAPTIEPGETKMDGALALAYVRSRKTDSDYERVARQRKFLSALAAQIGPTDAARAFGTLTETVGESVRTSMTSAEFVEMIEVLGRGGSITESVGLVPPLVNPAKPDYDDIAAVIDKVQQSLASGTPSGY